MSLNGLDEAAIVEAHQAALADAGGWFLVKYANRDTVTLLSRGIGGVVETRLAVEQYEEKSPLYGLVQYRRKKIILKYVPEGTSRLLQVRLTVQFQSVLETLIPHDTVFSFASSSELTESALSSACLYGTRAGSMKSSTSSLRRRRLDEITEEDAQIAPHTAGADAASTTLTPSATLPTAAALSPERSDDIQKAGDSFPSKTQPLEPANSRPTTAEVESTRKPPTHSQDRELPALPQALKSAVDKSLPATPLPTTPSTRDEDTVKPTEDQPLPPSDVNISEPYGRDSSHYDRRSIAESDRDSSPYIYTPSYALPKQKKKLGPRPHVEGQSRPKTSGSAKSSVAPRPVANLPTSIQVSNRAPSTASFRPDSRQSSRSVPTQYINFTAPVLPPPLPSPTGPRLSSLYKPPQTRPSQQRAQTNPLTPTATPEKLRLMKALQMRKKNMMLAQRASTLSYAASETEGRATPVQSDTSSTGRGVAESRDLEKSQSHPTKPNDEFDGTHDPMSSTASPISLTHLSEKPSTQSSFTTDNDGRVSRGSISSDSDTGSSVTPKADVHSSRRRRSSATKKSKKDRDSLTTSKVDDLSQEQITPTPEVAAVESSAKDLTIVNITAAKIDPPKRSPVEIEHARTLSTLNDVEFDEDEPSRPRSSGPRTVVQESSPVPASQDATKKANRKSIQRETLDVSAAHPDKKRRGMLDALKTVSSPETSEASDDDSFMDELQHAKVEEAKPISVARSPATPVYSRGSSDRLKDLSRATSTPIQKATEFTTSPDRPRTGSRSIRSVASTLPQWPPLNSETTPVQLAKKATLSSGISRRIKALEVFSSRESVASPPSSSSQTVTQKSSKLTMPSFRKRVSLAPQQQPPNTSINTPPPNELPASESTLAPEHDSTLHPIPWVHRHGSDTEINAPTQKGESISVTARIVRGNSVSNETKKVDPTEPVHMNLFRSPLIIEQHEKNEATSARPATTREVSFQSQEPQSRSPLSERARISFSSYRSAPQNRLHTSDSMVSHMSTATKKSGATMPLSMSDNSSFTDEKKESRASKLKKRISILSTGSRRSLLGALSPKKKENRSVATITEQNETDFRAERKDSDMESMAHVVDIGDLNVQFPDTLLWKRRFMKIDDQGYVIFSPPAMERNPRGISRKFHLSDFKKPCLPDNEREEMLWSIKLELGDGSCIQCACENRYAQDQVLIMLVNAHAAYHSLYTH